MFPLLLVLFIVVPFVELLILFQISGVIGPVPTLGLIVLTGVIGASLARWQGARVLWQIRDQLQSGSLPGDSLIDAAMILVAGAVLLTPGVLTDAFGFSLLIPPLRALYRRALKHWFTSRFQINTMMPQNPFPQREEHVIRGEAVDPEEK